MNREVLFRGKRIDNREWIGGFYYSDIWGDGITEYIMCDGKECEVIPETIGECTGVDTDEERKQIYEGDIIKFDNGNVCFTGRVDKACGAWGIISNDNIPLNYDDACNCDNFISFWEIIWNAESLDFVLDNVVPYTTIIGNIHDNPELMEG